MNTLLVCHSTHHGNTAKVAEAMATALPADCKKPGEVDAASLQRYDLIGFGSGIYMGKYHRSLVELVDRLPEQQGKQVFLFSTNGIGNVQKQQPLLQRLQAKGYVVIGDFSCRGLNTYGPFGLVGGVSRGRPNAQDLAGAAEFAAALPGKMKTRG